MRPRIRSWNRWAGGRWRGGFCLKAAKWKGSGTLCTQSSQRQAPSQRMAAVSRARTPLAGEGEKTTDIGKSDQQSWSGRQGKGTRPSRLWLGSWGEACRGECLGAMCQGKVRKKGNGSQTQTFWWSVKHGTVGCRGPHLRKRDDPTESSAPWKWQKEQMLSLRMVTQGYGPSSVSQELRHSTNPICRLLCGALGIFTDKPQRMTTVRKDVPWGKMCVCEGCSIWIPHCDRKDRESHPHSL